ncbi:monocarboxylate transporter 9 isoform X1 [Drosophila virilis]|uniref:monocarboxylate transporter 9 isoform X1 n=3 Tax=Drosophila virilis TaxID=7244 RepID=UPI001395D92D|nr:uncharacterized protein LOC26531046 isoform X1 [Drosophila virilis]
MSRKRSQGSRTPPSTPPLPLDERRYATPEEECERTFQARTAAQGLDHSDVASTGTGRTIDGERQPVEALPMPLILLAAPLGPREMKDAQVNTDPVYPPGTHVENRPTVSTVPVVPAVPVAGPNSALKPTRSEIPHKSPTTVPYNQMHGRKNSRRSTSSDNYDQDEPLTTKKTKVFKKRHAKPNPAADESDDSILVSKTTNHNLRKSNITAMSDFTDIPRSDESDRARTLESSSIKYSSSGTIIVTEGEVVDLDPNDFQQRNLPPNLRLASGLAFIYMAIPPDGGYGWVVLILSFLAQLIVDGIVFTIGILLPHMANEFNVSNGQVVLVGSVQIGCYFFGGAFSSALINIYGFRPVALGGVIISALAMLAASFSPSLSAVIFFYSIIVAAGGPGLSMIWVSSQLIIGFYFERYRPIASGFSCSGAGAGILIFSITNNILVQNMGWRNTIRIQVILVCLLLFVAIAYLEVAPSPVGVVHQADPLTSSSSNEYYGNFYVHNFLGDDFSVKRSHNVIETYEPPSKKKGKLRRCIQFCCPCCGKSKLKEEWTASERSERNYVVRPDPLQRDDLFYTGPIDYEEPHHKEQFDGKELELVGTQTHLQSAAYGLHNIHNYDGSSNMSETGSGSDGRLRPLAPKHTFSTAPQPHRRKKSRKPRKRGWLHTKVMKGMNRLFDVHLLKSFEFRILLAAAFFYPMGFNIPFLYSKMRTSIPAEYARMIGPAIGASNFVTRILCGFIAYKLRSWTNYICGGGMFLGGVMVFISAFFGTDLIWFQMVYGLCYGIAPAVYATLRALIYVRYLGLTKLTNAFGITALAMGLGVFIGTTLGGLLLDKTGGYVVPFAFAGLCIMLAGALKLILPALLKWRRKQYQSRALHK